MVKAALLGATGYAGQQLTALLHGHPHIDIYTIGSNSSAGGRFSDEYGKFVDHLDDCDTMTSTDELMKGLQHCDVLLLALPHGASKEIVTSILKDSTLNHLKIVDLGSDFRFNSQHPEAVYGLCEINREAIKQARLVANPGCYPTAAVLALTPLLKMGEQFEHLLKVEDLAQNTLIIDAKSGISGAGRSPVTKHLFAEIYGNAYPYKIGDHPHTNEIEQALEVSWPIQFTPNIIPVNRGIIENIYVKLSLKESIQSEAIEHLFQELYSDYYRQSPFVRIRRDRLPMLTDVTYSNHCDIGFRYDVRTGLLVIVSTIDNLMKGAAGQAVQNINLMFGFDESAGLTHLPAHL